MGLREEGFWDKHYELELKNFEEDGDEGEVWFGRGLSRRIADWLVNQLLEHNGEMPTVLDVGCGNGFTLCTLIDKYRKKSEHCLDPTTKLKLIGIDYSKNSIDLSKKIIAAKNLDTIISLMQCDFLDQNQLELSVNGENFDFIIDIGTFDAICLLSQETPEKLHRAKCQYLMSLYSLAKDGTKLILASCNHTEEEIMSLFEIEISLKLIPKLIHNIETPKIQFGGKEGSQVTCLIFELLTKADQ